MDSLFQLALLAASIGLLHTAMGPDHYLPFVVLGRAEGWTLRKTLFWTAVCGVAHVLSSVVLGGLGMGLGWAVPYMEGLEGVRGDLASYALIGFGLLYFAWGLWRGRRGHAHSHRHLDGTVHTHAHHHEDAEEGSTHELREHEETPHVKSHRRTLWALFVVFVLGPTSCGWPPAPSAPCSRWWRWGTAGCGWCCFSGWSATPTPRRASPSWPAGWPSSASASEAIISCSQLAYDGGQRPS